jgi:hypothetical protein
LVKNKESSKPSIASDDIILSAYLGRKVAKRALDSAIRRLNIEGAELGGDVTLLDAAVAEVLLASTRDTLPQWAVVKDGHVTLGRKKTRVRRTIYRPQHLFTLNWADSGPGFSWPMAYHATAVSAFKSVVVTASADGTDAYGFTDFAIGHFLANVDLLVGAREVITKNWARQAAEGQGRWVYLFDEALVSATQAEEWADSVWPKNGEENDADDVDP